MDAMTRATVFGLDVWSDEAVAPLQGACARSTGRVLDVLIDRRPDISNWPTDAKLISAQSEPDGSFAVRIDAHAEAGYRLSGPRYGAHVLSRDGRRLRCLPEQTPPAEWQRFLIAQVLPFAAALHGL